MDFLFFNKNNLEKGEIKMGTIIVGGVIEKDGKFLLVQEAQEKCRGKWNIPAGHLDPNENIFDGAKREVFEETGCKVELKNVLQIANKVLENDIWISVVFSTDLLEENITYDNSEILDAKWFSYEELLNMKDELRSYDWIINSISNSYKHSVYQTVQILISREEPSFYVYGYKSNDTNNEEGEYLYSQTELLEGLEKMLNIYLGEVYETIL